MINDIYLLAHIVQSKCRLLFLLPASNCCQKTSEQACPLQHHCQPMPPPSLQGLHVVTAHKENTILHLGFQSISPTCHFNVFFSYQILFKFISICFPRLFYVACLLHALWLPPLFTADFFTLLTNSGWVQLLSKHDHFIFLLVSFALSKKTSTVHPIHWLLSYQNLLGSLGVSLLPHIVLSGQSAYPQTKCDLLKMCVHVHTCKRTHMLS